MKILSTQELKKLDAYSVKNAPVTRQDLVENAAQEFCRVFSASHSREKILKIFIGPGNNGADGLAAARILTREGYEVKAYILRLKNKPSKEFSVNEERLRSLQTVAVYDLKTESRLPKLESTDIVIDAIFGTGLNRTLEEDSLAGKVVKHINAGKAEVVALDIPSGMFADKPTTGLAVKADQAIAIQLPRYCFFFPESYEYLHDWKITKPIGLDESYISNADSLAIMIDHGIAAKILSNRKRKKFTQKRDFGHALIIAGSKGKAGAAFMCAKASVVTGSGLTTALLPAGMETAFYAYLPEAMSVYSSNSEIINEIPVNPERFSCIGFGPGVGKTETAIHAFEQLLEKTTLESKLVIDADALNILSLRRELLEMLPPYSVITPHQNEFERLAGKAENHYQRIEMAKGFARANNIIVVLKGAYTAIATPDDTLYFNSTGNTGLAKGGTGDVLTGIITSLIAQGWSQEEACVLGVYLHGLAADIAVKESSVRSLTPSDIIACLGKAYQELEKDV